MTSNDFDAQGTTEGTWPRNSGQNPPSTSQAILDSLTHLWPLNLLLIDIEKLQFFIRHFHDVTWTRILCKFSKYKIAHNIISIQGVFLLVLASAFSIFGKF